MNVSHDEARKTVDEIEQLMQATDKKATADSAFPFLILWGVIWFIFPLWVHLYPQKFMIACVIFPIGGVGTWLLGISKRQPVQTKSQRNVGVLWLVLFVFIGLLAFIMKPDTVMQGYAFGCISGMLVYVILGILQDRIFIVIGLSITVMTLLGLYVFTDIFWLWMAVFGGGGLLVSGVYMKYGRR